MRSRLVPFKSTETAFKEMSKEWVTLAAGALARSQALKSLRRALSCARYDFTTVLLKSILLPCGGLVLAARLKGSPLSSTIARVASVSGRVTAASDDDAWPNAAGAPARANRATALRQVETMR